MVEIPIWLYFLIIALCCAGTASVTSMVLGRRKKRQWLMEIDRASNYWFKHIGYTIECTPDAEIPDRITISIANPRSISFSNSKETIKKDILKEN